MTMWCLKMCWTMFIFKATAQHYNNSVKSDCSVLFLLVDSSISIALVFGVCHSHGHSLSVVRGSSLLFMTWWEGFQKELSQFLEEELSFIHLCTEMKCRIIWKWYLIHKNDSGNQNDLAGAHCSHSSCKKSQVHKMSMRKAPNLWPSSLYRWFTIMRNNRCIIIR
jgi:hypothetical protein